MDDATSKLKSSKQAGATRYATLMKHLYPDDPSRRFRTPVATVDAKAGPVASGEQFFTENFGKRRG